jgi:hypothetical protein
MHYANGRAAKIGDLVRGKGYNIKHEIVGIVVGATPAATACNCTVACVARQPQYATQGTKSCSLNLDGTFADYNAQFKPDVTIEYGQLDAFVALCPKTGEILPPETAETPAA